FESSEKEISESENQSENDCQVVENVCDDLENPNVIAPEMFKLSVSQSDSPVSVSKMSCASNKVKTKTKRKRRNRNSAKQTDKQVNNFILDTLSSVRRLKPSGVMWKKKGSSNTVKADLSSINHSNLNKNVKRYNRKDLLSCNNSHLVDTKISKMSLRKKPSASLNVPSRRKSLKYLPRIVRKWLPTMKLFAEPVAKWIPRIVQICLWIIDSGCSKHMTGNRALLTNFVEKFLGTVRFGNNDFAVIAGYGDVIIGSMMIKKVYYVEGLVYNLFSVGKFCDKSLEVAFRRSACFVRNENGVDLLTGDRSSNLYTIPLNGIASNSSSCILAKASSSQSWLWHQQSINGKRYVLVVVDDFSRYTWVFFLHSKDEASEVIISFIKKTQVNLQLQVQRIRTDNGTEFKNKTLAMFFDEVGISQQFSDARTPQQNGIVERRNCTLVETARTMLTFANLPLFLWAEAIATACLHKILKAKGDIRVFVGYSKDSAAFRVYNKQTRKIHESVNVNFDKISEMASKQFSFEPDFTNLNKKRKSSNPTISQVEETLKKDLEDLFHNFYDEYFDASKLKKSLTTNVETSNNDGEVFYEVSKSFQGESYSSLLNDDVQESPKEVILPQTNTLSISNDMIPNVDEASSSHNVFNE
nr:hypothetical protein [Tanacetum cinerariifolium]